MSNLNCVGNGKSYQVDYDKERRSAPEVCNSMYCGRIECDGCDELPALREFENWVKDKKARRVDPIRLPGVFEATL